VTDKGKTKSEAAAVEDILDEAHAIELEEKLAGMSDADVDTFLAKAGVTQADLDKSDARERELYEASRKSKVVPIGSRRRRDVVVAAGSLGIAASFMAVLSAAGAITLAVGAKPTTPIGTVTAATASADDAGPPSSTAQDLRYKALREFALGEYPGCIRDFDEAKALDPAGDNDLAIRNARHYAAIFMQPRDQ
jgi:hypothetical protein